MTTVEPRTGAHVFPVAPGAARPDATGPDAARPDAAGPDAARPGTPDEAPRHAAPADPAVAPTGAAAPAPAAAVAPSLGARLRGTDNAFGFLRLVLAMAVVVHHTWPLGGFGGDPVGIHLRSQTDPGIMAVDGFFVISGFLITKSGRSHDVVAFLWHRALRILPAFWTMLVVIAFAVGPVVWLARGRTLGAYFGDAVAPWRFVTQNLALTVNSYGIGDLVSGAPYSRQAGPVVIGSAWTLIYEARCYLVVAVLVATAVLTRWSGVVLAATAALYVEQLTTAAGLGPVVPWLGDPWTLQLTLVFLYGASVAVAGHRIPFDHRIAAGAGVGVLASLHWGGWIVAGLPCAAYLLLYLAAALPPVLRRVGRTRDISYGVYIWGFPAQQFLAQAGVAKAGFVPFLLASVAVSVVLGYASWYAVEKWALRLKDRGPGRGLRGLQRWWTTRSTRTA